jgi:hypothetical protein
VDSNENEKKELWPFASKRVSDYCLTPNWRSIKEDFHVQGAWHSAHTLPKMVHGQVFRGSWIYNFVSSNPVQARILEATLYDKVCQ